MLPGLLTILTLALLAGAILLTLGLRGRRINDHPICRRCKFDLVGIHPAAERCPECGRLLTHPRAVRRGARRRRRGMLAAAIPLLLIGLIGGTTAAWVNSHNVYWYEHMPTWWVYHDARSATPAVADRALNELRRRVTAHALSAKECAPIIAHILEVQSGPAQSWNTGWGNVFEAASWQGYCTDEQSRQYVRQGVEFHAIVRPRVVVGNSAGFSFQFIYGKYGDFADFPYQIETRLKQASIGDQVCQGVGYLGTGARGVTDAATRLTQGSPQWAHQELHPIPDTPGIYPVRLVAEVTAKPLEVLPDGTFGDPLDQPPMIWQLEAEGELQVVDAAASADLQLVTDDSLREVMQSVFRVERASRTEPASNQGMRRLHVILRQVGTPPVDLAMDVVGSDDNRELFRNSLFLPKGRAPDNGTAQYGLMTDRPLDIHGQLHVRLVPNPNQARRSGDILSIWGEEIDLGRFDVEVDHEDP